MQEKILDLFRLNNQVALVIGGNRGLGFVMAQTLAEAGASLAIASRNTKNNEEAVATLQSEYGIDAASFACDVTDEQSVKQTVQGVISRFGKIDILINSAGVNIRGPIEKLTLNDFNLVQQVNVTGAWLACREVVPLLKKNGYGRIINIGSIFSVVTIPDRTPYATSKGAILQLSRTLALELAKKKITVNTILPGPFATEMNLPLTQDPEKFQEFISKIPMGRWGELYEIGGLALYLASPAASFVTGASFCIDGGWTAQ